MVRSTHVLLSMHSRLTLYLVLVNNLRVNVKPMHRLYSILKDREEPPTPDKIAIACGKKKLDGNTEAEYIKQLENTSENIKKAFEDQQARAGVSENCPFNFNYLHLIKHFTGTLGSGKI
jgi:hypothetical protein